MLRGRMSALARVRLTYFCLYAFVGVLGPFFSPYIRSLGFSGLEVGVLSAILPVAASWVPPLWGALADRLGESTRPLRLALVLGALVLLPFPFARGFWPLFGLLVAFASTRAGAGALIDSVTLALIERQGGDFGRARLFGSLGFLAAAGLIAVLARDTADVAIAWALVAAQAAAAAVSLALPRVERARSVDVFRDVARLLRTPGFARFLAVSFLIQLAGTGPLLFYPVHLGDAGGSNVLIAGFWATGVSAEVVFFFFARRIAAAVGPGWLFLAAILAIPLRFAPLLVTGAPAVMLSLQTLHAINFGAAFYVSVLYANRLAPPALQASAQALFIAVSFGLASGLGTVLAGALYDAWDIQGVLWFGTIAALLSVLPALPVARHMNAARVAGGS